MYLKFFLIALLSINFSRVHAQDDHDHDHASHHHEHHTFEVGVAASPVYFIDEEETSFSIHTHFLLHIPNTEFGIGLGYEHIFDDHEHKTVGLIGSYRILHNWSIHLSPGVTFEKDEDGRFAFHGETTYEWEFDFLHIGPALEIAYDPEDIHISFGIHTGIGF